MHIRKLEIQGFKSFADRAAFHFGPGISGVVGPNGCGKSNVVDAVKWCLGEQSAKSLRGGSMNDIIFAGTQARPPMGMAEVSLTFVAADVPFAGEYAHHEEVRITRRIYRDGGSEYRINDGRCRLRDIQDLFLDTGANNRMYSFIEQGRIGQIISARPDQRRALIEEAAGISRYKARKDEAERRLDDTLGNLEQVQRQADDLGARMRSLERQVKRAVRYRRLKSRVRQAEIFLGLARFAGLIGDRRALSSQRRQAEGDEASAIRKVTVAEERIAKERAALRELEGVAGTLRDELAELEATRRETESARQYQAREQRELERRLDTLGADAEKATGEQASATARQDGARRERHQVATRLETLELELTQARDALGKAQQVVVQRRRAIDRGKDVVLKLVQGIARQRAAHEVADQQRRELEGRRGRLREQAGTVVTGIDALEAAVTDALRTERSAVERSTASREALDAARGREAEARRTGAGAREAVRAAEQARAVAVRDQAAASRTLAGLRARLDAIEALQAAHAGVDDAVRPALGLPGVLGTLAEHLDVPPELEETVAVVLGPALELLLVEDDAAAVRAAAAITEGRVGILSLERAPGEVLGFAARLGGSATGRRALARLFEGAGQEQDIAAGLALHRDRGGVVVVDGERPALVEARGTLRVGRATGAGLAILARRRQIAALQEEVAVAAAAEEAAGGALDAAQQVVAEAETRAASAATAVDAASAAVADARGMASDAEMALRLAQRERSDKERDRDREIARQERMARDLEGLGKRIEQAAQKVDELQRQVTADQQRQAEAEAALHADQAGLVAEEGAAERVRERRDILAGEVATLRERHLALQREERSAEQATALAAERARSTAEEMERAHGRVAELAADDSRLEKALAELQERQLDVDRRHTDARAAVDALRTTIAALDDELRTHRDAQQTATAARSELDRTLAQVKADILHIRESLEDRHEVSPAGLLDRIDRIGQVVIGADAGAAPPGDGNEGETAEDDAVDVEDLRITAAMLEDEDRVADSLESLQRDRAALQRLGEVNLVAQQEYEEVRAAHDALVSQREDLEESVRTIRQTIGRLNKTCRERFRDTFDQVDTYFRETYPRLVGGGQARLLLTDEEDLLETGVDIMVQPPGKKLQALTLLSGGEMAMTAIALIFSLFRVKPSPFCLLDEVDAPLDEGNGARFNQTLREMAKLSQFIVITHNKKTMECADTLYGVTMAVPGVSRLVTVQLD